MDYLAALCGLYLQENSGLMISPLRAELGLTQGAAHRCPKWGGGGGGDHKFI